MYDRRSPETDIRNRRAGSRGQKTGVGRQRKEKMARKRQQLSNDS